MHVSVCFACMYEWLSSQIQKLPWDQLSINTVSVLTYLFRLICKSKGHVSSISVIDWLTVLSDSRDSIFIRLLRASVFLYQWPKSYFPLLINICLSFYSQPRPNDRMSDAFSSNFDSVLQRGVDVTSGIDAPLENVEEQYQIKRTCDFINDNGFKKVDIIGTLLARR